jgi:uncharacterized membrane protein YphA (DoxX/SURF4 family)
MFKRQVLLECISALLILLFVYASLSKFLDWHTFKGEMGHQPLPHSLTRLLVWIVPFSEIAISVSVIFERSRLLGFYASVVLMGVFSVYTAVVLMRLLPFIPCSCGGVIKRLTWPQHLVLNLSFTALSVYGVILQRRKQTKPIFLHQTNTFV